MNCTKRKLSFEKDGELVEKAKRFGLPDRWLYCPPMGKIIAEKFLPMKTPLSEAYDALIPEKKYQFHPNFVFQRTLSDAKNCTKIGMWIDLTKTSRYYSKNEVEKNQCIYKKFALAGHKQSPTIEETAQFIKCVNEFFETHPNEIIAIHCTHGFNRTGFLISAYLHEVCDYAIDMAVDEFAKCRRNGIYKQDYLNDLCKRYQDDDDEIVLEVAGRPLWENQPLSDDDYFFGFYVNNINNLNQIQSTSSASSSLNQSNHDTNANDTPQFMNGSVPSVTLVKNLDEIKYLRMKARNFCKFNKNGFPGSQPVSLEKEKNLRLLSELPYMFSWKADGTRYLILIEGEKQVYAFDRDNNVFQINDVYFINGKSNNHIKNTLLDSEMIIEKITHSNGRIEEIPRLLIYDIIAFENINLGKENFLKRFTTIYYEIINPRLNAFETGRLNRKTEPISVRRKDFWELKYTYKIFEENFQKSINHEIDGLIFQPVNLPYIAGKCDKMLKWKPPSHCTIDFLLKIEKVEKFGFLPETRANLYVLHYEPPFAQMKATKDLKKFNQKIIECNFNFQTKSWEFVRHRTDKSYPNAYTTAVSVQNTLINPISLDYLLKFISEYGYEHKKQKI